MYTVKHKRTLKGREKADWLGTLAPEGVTQHCVSFLLSLINFRLGVKVFGNPEAPTGADRPKWPQRKPSLCSQQTRKEQPLKTENSAAEAALLQANALEETSSIPPVPEGPNEGPRFHLLQAVTRHPKPARVGSGKPSGRLGLVLGSHWAPRPLCQWRLLGEQQWGTLLLPAREVSVWNQEPHCGWH